MFFMLQGQQEAWQAFPTQASCLAWQTGIPQRSIKWRWFCLRMIAVDSRRSGADRWPWDAGACCSGWQGWRMGNWRTLREDWSERHS